MNVKVELGETGNSSPARVSSWMCLRNRLRTIGLKKCIVDPKKFKTTAPRNCQRITPNNDQNRALRAAPLEGGRPFSQPFFSQKEALMDLTWKLSKSNRSYQVFLPA